MMETNQAMNLYANGELEKVNQMIAEFEQCIWMMDCKTFELKMETFGVDTIVFSWKYGAEPFESVVTNVKQFTRQVVQTADDFLNTIKAYLYDVLVIVAFG